MPGTGPKLRSGSVLLFFCLALMTATAQARLESSSGSTTAVTEKTSDEDLIAAVDSVGNDDFRRESKGMCVARLVFGGMVEAKARIACGLTADLSKYPVLQRAAMKCEPEDSQVQRKKCYRDFFQAEIDRKRSENKTAELQPPAKAPKTTLEAGQK